MGKNDEGYLRIDTRSRSNWLELIESLSRQPVRECYGCGKCSAGCPTAYAMDLDPARIVEYALLGRREELLSSSAIWLCVGCETCGTRCPNGISVGRIIDSLKALTARSGIKPGVPAVYRFHLSFLNSIRRFGRVHEISMLIEYKLRSGDLLSDLALGLKLLRAGKLPLLPRTIAGRREVARMFQPDRDATQDEDQEPAGTDKGSV